MSTDVAFFETTPFSLPSIVTRQGEEEDLLIYTLASSIVSPESAFVPAIVVKARLGERALEAQA